MAARRTVEGRTAGLFAAGFVLLLAVLALLDHFGLPPGALAAILTTVVLASFAALGVSTGTMQASTFYLAGRSLPAPVNGIASAAVVVSALFFLGLAGDYYADPTTAVALTLGVSLGFILLGAGVAPYFRKSSAFGLVDFLGLRYGGRPIRVVAFIFVAIALIAALTGSLAAAARILTMLLGVPQGTALTVVTLVVMVSTVLGGMQAVTRITIVQFVVAVIAIVVPIGYLAFREYSLPVPLLAFGYAARDAALLALASGKDLAPALPGIFAPPPAGGFAAFASMLVLATGITALPPLLMRSATVRGTDRARRSAAWGLLAVLLVALTAPAYATFVRLILLREVVDTGIDDLPGWVFAFGNLGLVHICGVAATSVDTVLTACNALPDFVGNLDANDLAVSSDAIVLAAPSIFDLPYVATALVGVGALAATLAAAAAITFAFASSVGHDFYAGVINSHVSAGRQLIMTRLASVAALALAWWFASGASDTAIALAPVAISISAGGLFPALILAVWWDRANAYGACASIVVGGVLTCLLLADHLFPGLLPFGPLGFDTLTAAIIGMPAAFVAAVAGSLATDPPSEERQLALDAIRRPGGAPIVQETESL